MSRITSVLAVCEDVNGSGEFGTTMIVKDYTACELVWTVKGYEPD